jgi:hypothetical protein
MIAFALVCAGCVHSNPAAGVGNSAPPRVAMSDAPGGHSFRAPKFVGPDALILLDCEERVATRPGCSIVLRNVRTGKTLARKTAPPSANAVQALYGAEVLLVRADAGPFAPPTYGVWAVAPLAELFVLPAPPNGHPESITMNLWHTLVAMSKSASWLVRSSCESAFYPDGGASGPNVCHVELFGSRDAQRIWTRTIDIKGRKVVSLSFDTVGAVDLQLDDRTTKRLDGATGATLGPASSPAMAVDHSPRDRVLPRGELVRGLQRPESSGGRFVDTCRYSTSAGQLSVVPAELCALADEGLDAVDGAVDAVGGWLVALTERRTKLVVLRLE